MSEPSPIDSSVLDLTKLFDGPHGPLQGVTFPDVDRETLLEHIDLVRRAADDVAQAQAMLAAAESALEERQSALMAKSHRAMAYARIYADENPALLSELDRITLPRTSALRAERRENTAPRLSSTRSETGGRPRGRPRKSTDETSLFAVPTRSDLASEPQTALDQAPAAE
jgi:hypothetical protein